MAYRRDAFGFVKLDDHNVAEVLPAQEDYFVTVPAEKVYVLFYVKRGHIVQDDTGARTTKFRRITSSIEAASHESVPRQSLQTAEAAKAVDLDTDSDVVIQQDSQPGHLLPVPSKTTPATTRMIDLDSESDVAMEPHLPARMSPDANRKAASDDDRPPVPSPTSNDQSEVPRKPLMRFTPEERLQIQQVLQDCSTTKEAMDALAVTVPKLTSKDKKAPGYVSYWTLRNWLQNPSSFEKAFTAANRQVLDPPERSQPVSTIRASLSTDDNLIIHEALQEATCLDHLVNILIERLEEFSASDPAAAKYISKSTLRRWMAQPPICIDSWETEFDRTFTVAMTKPAKREPPASDTMSVDDRWLIYGSWTFCPACGRRRPRSSMTSTEALVCAIECKPRCDPDAEELLQPPPAIQTKKLQGYVTPMSQNWEALLASMEATGLPLLTALTKDDLESLAIVDLKVTYRSRRGGHAEITSKQKQTLIRARWKPMPLTEVRRSEKAAVAFDWLRSSNSTYAAWIDKHMQRIQEGAAGEPYWREIPTAELLLNSPGIEIAARPWLYPLPSFAETDLATRLKELTWIAKNSTISMRQSFLRKITSRCLDYSRDFQLHCLLYDVCMAKSITSIISVANKMNIAPEQAASQQDAFEGYWWLQLRKMEDVCRREFELTQDMSLSLPNVFFTVAPAEWRYLLPNGLMYADSLTEQQDLLTLHLYHTLEAMLEKHLLKDGCSLHQVGLANVKHWSFRFEFQSRGTLHIHAVLWAQLLPGWSSQNISGRTDGARSAFVQLLETLFKSRADVQCGDGNHCLLRYVAGYVAKASDAMQFSKHQSLGEGHWRQAYRLLCKKSPTEQEMLMEFSGLAMVKHSFSGVDIFAPIPGSRASNSSTRQYRAYQHHLHHQDEEGDARELTFIQWLRQFQLTTDDPQDMSVHRRNIAGPSRNKIAGVAMHFPFELLDIYLGAWAASCLPGMDEKRLLPSVPDNVELPGYEDELTRRRSFLAPDGAKHLKSVLCLDQFQLDGADSRVYNPDITKLFRSIEPELTVRGLNGDRIATFKAKVEATNLLLLQIRDGKEDPEAWSARKLPGFPARQWSPEQQQVLDFVKHALRVEDAAEATRQCRLLHVSGSPGTGKTEVVIAAAELALADDCKVLVGGPIGLLVAMYKLRLPTTENLTMETIHSAFKITRDADAAYVPPGRLRRYDLIILDEISQIDETVWGKLKVALNELLPGPLVLFVGDEQQLQPVHGRPRLLLDLASLTEAGKARHVRLQQHEMARSVDPTMLTFLNKIRSKQPTRPELERFFRGRVWDSNIKDAVKKSYDIETTNHGKKFMFLTVTNKAAAALNQARLELEFPEEARRLSNGEGLPGEIANILLTANMRVRLTHNVNKEEGYVNGNTGQIRKVLRRDVFIMESSQHTCILVYPITVNGRRYLPVAYGYATTMRRAQGATMDAIGLLFDRRMPDRGYAYVGTSRAKLSSMVFHLGRIRQTDWLPVGGTASEEHTCLSALSDSSDEQEESEEPPTESPEAASTDFDVDESSMEDHDFLPADSPEPSFSDFQHWHDGLHQCDYMKDQDFLPADSPEPSLSDFDHWHDA